MKAFLINKNIVAILVGVLFLSMLFWLASNFESTDRNHHLDQNVQSAKVDVEMTEEDEDLDETIEDEIEGYIEEDISDLDFDVEEVPDEDVSEEAVAEEAEETVPVLPFVPKNYSHNELRVGFMTDIHAKSDSGESRSDRIIKDYFSNSINRFIEKMNNEYFPDFLLLNGDVIEGHRDEEIGSGELRSIKKMFDRTPIPKYWVVGNHDLRAVDKDLWKQSLQIDYLAKAFDVRGYRVIIMDSNFDKEGNDVGPELSYTRGCVEDDQVKWLDKQLKTDKKKIVFIHHPPLWSVDTHSNSGLPFNAQELQKVFRENNVTAVFAGHIEDFYYDKIDGVKYFVIPGVVKSEKYRGTYAEISFLDDEVEMNVSYMGKNDKYRKVNIKDLAD